MKRYPQEQKEAIIQKMMPPMNKRVSELVAETGISDVTLYTWRKQARNGGLVVPGDGKNPEKWSAEEKFRVVLETAPLSAAELAEYCRKKGLYAEQVASWREACIKGNLTAAELDKAQREQSRQDKQQIKALERELRRKEKALAEAAALLVLRKKGQCDLGGRRGRMISASDRSNAITLIEEAVTAGARRFKACGELGITIRTLQRWTATGEVKVDGRPTATRPAPAHKLSEAEREEILRVANSEAYQSLPPSQIVPALADQGRYLASESSFYRVLRDAEQQHARGRSQAPKRTAPTTHIATAPNQVWCWDITWLPGPAKGVFFYLYLIMDLFSRKIVGWEIHEQESAEDAASLVSRTHLREQVGANVLVLHSDNGSPMKGASLVVTLDRLGVASSYSRPRVSNDNAFAESLFRTCKYRPDYPYKGFASLTDARQWVLEFTHWYNYRHKHSGIKFITPSQRHDGEATAVMRQRKQVYEMARANNPARWSGQVRNWNLPMAVQLNPANAAQEKQAVS
ncbi:MAG: IS3 family transposase [Pseudomonadota bacterium]